MILIVQFVASNGHYFLISPRFALAIPRWLYSGSFFAIKFSICAKKKRRKIVWSVSIHHAKNLYSQVTSPSYINMSRLIFTQMTIDACKDFVKLKYPPYFVSQIWYPRVDFIDTIFDGRLSMSMHSPSPILSKTSKPFVYHQVNGLPYTMKEDLLCPVDISLGVERTDTSFTSVPSEIEVSSSSWRRMAIPHVNEHFGSTFSCVHVQVPIPCSYTLGKIISR